MWQEGKRIKCFSCCVGFAFALAEDDCSPAVMVLAFAALFAPWVTGTDLIRGTGFHCLDVNQMQAPNPSEG